MYPICIVIFSVKRLNLNKIICLFLFLYLGELHLNYPTTMQTVASLLAINVVQPAIDHLNIIADRCTRSQCSSSPCRCNLSMRSKSTNNVLINCSCQFRSFRSTCYSAYYSYLPQQRRTLTAMQEDVQVHRSAYTVRHKPTDMVTNTKTQIKPHPKPGLMCESNSCSGSQATLQGIHYY